MVSILVLLEWSSEVRPRHGLAVNFSVSILVLLEWSSEEDLVVEFMDQVLEVSILVLLEWSSEDIAQPLREHPAKGFNPCSIGMVF